MYYRRKILLSLLQLFGGKLQYTHLQKYLFLVTTMQEEPVYDFVPYEYGPFSFQSYADIRALIKRGFLTRSVRTIPEKVQEYYRELTKEDQGILDRIRTEFAKMSYPELIRYTYMNYPLYSVNSEILRKYLSQDEISSITDFNYSSEEFCLFTIGYEGISIDKFIHRLIRNDVRMLIDVRRNAMSMKYGYSKSQLIRLLGKFNIHYKHIPQLGIQSTKRKHLDTLDDYQRLFEEYSSITIPKNIQYLHTIHDLTTDLERIALMCYESEHTMCHRHRIVDALLKLDDWDKPFQHL